ncbi:MAG: hypothetical protein NC915_01755 [Candidatus Omnitrophica bacterium]|nr:hypothetical protein [Candidatus Omnitrophota bacterium]
MIKISIDLGTCFYLSISILILILWIFWERKKTTNKITENNLWQCPICFFEYIDSRSKEISKCPRCKTLFKKSEKW